ncbi:DUF1850 domain-containing protein [Oceanobacillus halotolerans]|uniref:DUF1850 domain-containing protein n=1 Tax=Oceanobacillus halotolerans TaxID=2663380 RepID=UPI0013DA829E|nr:DUF1850 domain-containing protein [Oceanobacillus halotolerans]
MGTTLLVIIGIFLLLSKVHVLYALDDNGNILIAERVNADMTFSSQYIHSVAKCPIIEKFEISDQYKMVLMESWNCSFGAGIETEPPPGATDRMEDGFYVIDNIQQVHDEIRFHPVAITDQVLTIGEKSWNVSRYPFVGKTFTVQIQEKAQLTYWLSKL